MRFDYLGTENAVAEERVSWNFRGGILNRKRLSAICSLPRVVAVPPRNGCVERWIGG